jgi:MFS family permease
VNTARIVPLSNLFPGLRPLRHRNFALYWSGLTVSVVGDWMETTTTAWLLYDITRSPVLLGVGGGLRAAAILVCGPIGGALADRVPRRRVLFLTQSAFALISLVLGLLVVSGRVEVWHIYVFNALNGAIGSFDAPARRSLFPNLVPRSEMQNAVMLNAAIFRLGRLVGPALAGVIIALFGPAVAYFVNVASYAAILVALAAMRVVEPALRGSGPLLRAAIQGLRYSLDRPLLRSVLLLESAHSLFGVNTALLTIIASDVLHSGPEGLGLLLSSQAIGALVGTVFLVMSGDLEHKGRAMMISGTAYCVMYAALAFATNFQIAAVLVAATGITDAIWTTMRNTIFQLQTEEAYRGRAMGTILLAGRGFTQAAQLETGVTVSFGGPGFAMLSGAALIALSLVAVNARTSLVRRFRGSGDPIVTLAGGADPPGGP